MWILAPWLPEPEGPSDTTIQIRGVVRPAGTFGRCAPTSRRDLIRSPHTVSYDAAEDGLELWTFQVNARARRFYERHGFVEVDRTDGGHNEERQPDVRYAWRPGA